MISDLANLLTTYWMHTVGFSTRKAREASANLAEWLHGG